MRTYTRRELEQIRNSSDLREGRVRTFVDDQVQHPDPVVSQAALAVLAGDVAVWELVDVLIEHMDLAEGFSTAMAVLDALSEDERQGLRVEAGADAASLQALLTPDPGEPSAEAAFYLDQLGARDGVSIEGVRDFFGVDPFALFRTEGLEERLDDVKPDSDVDEP